MCLFFETIKVVDGEIQNLNYHLNRIYNTQTAHYKKSNISEIEKFFEYFKHQENGTFKLKIIYSTTIKKTEITPYKLLIKNKLKFFEKSNLQYRFKFFDRSELVSIEKQLAENELGIVVQNQYLTDATYGNIVLWDGENYLTPNTTLLNGTKRQKYLDEGVIKIDTIKIHNLNKYKKLYLINSMIDLGEIEIDL